MQITKRKIIFYPFYNKKKSCLFNTSTYIYSTKKTCSLVKRNAKRIENEA